MLQTLLRLFALKDQTRTGWTLRGVNEPESVADHSWGTALLCMSYAAEAGVDAHVALEIAIVHDVAEAVTGDVPTRVATMNEPERKREKQRLEREAMDTLLDSAPSDLRTRVEGRWSEYEERSTPEAIFVRDMNLIDMCMQALIYERSERVGDPEGVFDRDGAKADAHVFPGLEEFFATTRPRLSTELGKRLFTDIYREYQALPSVSARSRGA
jgi:putative hydrolase of HD superfamily